jgi:hypothetical protein
MHRVLPSGRECSGERRKLYRVKAHRLEHWGGFGILFVIAEEGLGLGLGILLFVVNNGLWPGLGGKQSVVGVCDVSEKAINV